MHKHVTLLALLNALKRKDKPFAYFETHAGRGVYDLSGGSEEASHGIERLIGVEPRAPALRDYSALISDFRAQRGNRWLYPGSPAIAAQALRSQDRAVLCELVAAEARVLEQEVQFTSRAQVERGDGYQRLRAWLPPRERRGLTFMDPPYEEVGSDFDRVTGAVIDALHRFSTGVIAVWYPIKEERQVAGWRSALVRSIGREALAAELWLYPRDSRVALNGSGMMIVNAPYQLEDTLRDCLPELQTLLDVGQPGGTSVTKLAPE